jgi:hypothetical protein
MGGEAAVSVATVGQAATMDFAGAVRVNGGEQPRVRPIRKGEPRLRRPNTRRFVFFGGLSSKYGGLSSKYGGLFLCI